jgi:hypothetical protein
LTGRTVRRAMPLQMKPVDAKGGAMATDQSEKKAANIEQAAGAGTMPKIVWEDAKMRSVYANVANVAGGREELVLLFGMNQAWHAGQEEVKVNLTDRVVMSPFAAKRLSLLLNKVLADYEARYGKLDIAVGKAAQAPEL